MLTLDNVGWEKWNDEGDRIAGYSKRHIMVRGINKSLCGCVIPEHAESGVINDGNCKRCQKALDKLFKAGDVYEYDGFIYDKGSEYD